MNYTNVKCGNTLLPCYYGMEAMCALEADGLDISSILDQFTGGFKGKMLFTTIKQIIYEGLRDGHRKAGIDFKINKSDISDFVDENPDLLKECLSIMMESRFFKNLETLSDESESSNGHQKKKVNRAKELMKS